MRIRISALLMLLFGIGLAGFQLIPWYLPVFYVLFNIPGTYTYLTPSQKRMIEEQIRKYQMQQDQQAAMYAKPINPLDIN